MIRRLPSKTHDIYYFPWQLKIPSFKAISVYFPCAMLPTTAVCVIRRPEGFIQRIELCLSIEIDRSAWDAKLDVGSKPWLVAQALNTSHQHVHSHNGDYNECMSVYGESERGELSSDGLKNAGGVNGDNSDVREDEILPEDKFHLKLPANVDKYTGAKLDEDDAELPEDRFHKRDASSQYLINLREQGVKDKWAKYEKEKEEREKNKDPNVEYVEMDDYKPGGKYGPAIELSPEQAAAEEERKRASNVVASAIQNSEIGDLLSSTLHTELLD
jgi:hypothetical protein